MSDSSTQRDAVRRRQRIRWEFLEFLYRDNLELQHGHVQSVRATDAGEAIGLSDAREIEMAYTYLKDAGLIEYMGMGPYVRITRLGIDAVEEALSEPEAKSEYFPPVNQIHIWGSILGSQIVQGSPQANASMTVSHASVESIRTLLVELRTATSGLDGQRKTTVNAEIGTIEAQLESPAPRRTVIVECLTSVRAVLEQTGAALAAAKITLFLQQLGLL